VRSAFVISQSTWNLVPISIFVCRCLGQRRLKRTFFRAGIVGSSLFIARRPSFEEVYTSCGIEVSRCAMKEAVWLMVPGQLTA
jgi:hypothetical protein